jgi:hypothetical protein
MAAEGYREERSSAEGSTAQKGSKTCLLEVVVMRERPGEAIMVHDLKRGAIR